MSTTLGSGSHWRIDEIRLRIELDHASVTVEAELQVQSTVTQPGPMVLDGHGLQTLDVCVDGSPADDAVIEPRTLTLALTAGSHVVSTKVSASVGAPGDKGFVSYAGLLSTCLEPQGFRRLTWSRDEPSSRSVYDVTLVGAVADFPVMLSNGNLVDSGELAEGRHFARFHDPIPKPTYLFAMVGGHLDRRSAQHITQSGAVVTTTVVAPPDMIDGCEFALWAMDEVMRFDEQQGGIEHDLGELLYVAIPGYPDATEYHGLMFFEPTLLIADQTGYTDDDLLLIAANVAHEYGHHVRGNRVTVRTWGQLALKEGLTVLTAQNGFRRHLFGPATRVLDVLDLRRLQFPEEITIGAPVLRGEVSDPTALYNRTTYLKGAELFNMLRTLVGDERWREVMVGFIHHHDLGAAGVDDFVDALRQAAPERADAIDAVARWFTTAGRPSIVIEHHPGSDRVTVRRTDRLTDDPPLGIPVVVGLLDADGAACPVSIDGGPAETQALLLLTDRAHEWTLSAPVATVAPLRAYSAPVDVATDHSVAALSTLLRHDTDPYVRWWASEELMIRFVDTFRRGEPTGDLLAALTDALQIAVATIDDPLLLAQVLAVPDEFMLGDREPIIDVDGVAGGLDELRRRLGAALFETLTEVWGRVLAGTAAHGDGPAAIAQRMLVEPLLALLIGSGRDEGLALASSAFRGAQPTIAMRSFAQLAHSEAIALDDLADEAYQRWSGAPMLVERWMRAQSGARRADTIDRVQRLASGPLYNRADRSVVVALWFPFATRNRSVFHHPSGRGYRVFVDELGELMPTSSGTAVRLVGDLLQFQRFDAHRSALLRVELERMADMQGMPDFAVGILRHLLG